MQDLKDGVWFLDGGKLYATPTPERFAQSIELGPRVEQALEDQAATERFMRTRKFTHRTI